MITLAFDCCFDACSAAVRVGEPGGKFRLAHRFEPMQRGHAERLLPMLQEIAAEAGVALGEVGEIRLTHGPGTFTGTRIGVAAARALALVTGASVRATSSLHLIARQASARLAADDRGVIRVAEHSGGAAVVQSEHVPDAIVAAVDARRDEVYVQLFDGRGVRPLGPPGLAGIDAAARLVPTGKVIIAGSGAERVAGAARGRGESATVIAPLLPDALTLLDLDDLPLAAPVRPLYLRAPDAKPQAARPALAMGDR